MPSGYYTLDQLAKAAPTVRSASPLDSTEPKIEPEEPRDDYHKDWGFYAFLYESPETLAAGGLTSLVPIGFGGALNLAPPDVWQTPNLDLLEGTPEAEPAPASDLFDLLCTAANMANNDEVRGLCETLATLDGCRMLNAVMPNITDSASDVQGVPFANGCAYSMALTELACSGGWTVGRMFLTISCASTTKECDAYWPKNFSITDDIPGFTCGGPLGIFLSSSFGRARDRAMQCLKDEFGETFAELGCV